MEFGQDHSLDLMLSGLETNAVELFKDKPF